MKKKIVFMGTPDFSVPILSALISSELYEVVLVVTQPDRPVGRKRTLTPPPVKKEAIKHELPVYQPEKLKDAYEEILAYEPDLIITAAYGQLLPKSLLDAPSFGSINVHASLLPELRGGAPIHYAILQGKKETGISIMYMAEKLDAGDVISQAKVAIENDDHTGILHDKLSQLGTKLLLETLPSIFAGTNERTVQDEDKASFAPNISREQEKIDWKNSAEVVYNQVRGLHPWPVAYTIFEGKRMKVWWAKPTKINQTNSQAGEIIQVSDTAIVVACGDDNAIALTDVQIAGKKRMTIESLLLGNPALFQVGQILE